MPWCRAKEVVGQQPLVQFGEVITDLIAGTRHILANLDVLRLEADETLQQGNDIHSLKGEKGLSHRKNLFMWIQGPVKTQLMLKWTPMIVNLCR